MSFFPDSVMPKRLRKEDQHEVNGSPLIYNAKDYNTHHREILAIERALIAKGVGDNSPVGLDEAISLLESRLDDITKRGLIARATGTILPGDKIRIPNTILWTKTSSLSTNSNSINVDSTTGFAPSGYITKINALLRQNSSPTDYLLQEQTLQEVISYTSISGNTFHGCTRNLFGTNAQVLPYTTTYHVTPESRSDSSIIIGGRASFSYFPLKINLSVPAGKIILWHEADLTLGMEARSAAGDVLDISNSLLGYSLMVVGQIPKIDLSKLFSG